MFMHAVAPSPSGTVLDFVTHTVQIVAGPSRPGKSPRSQRHTHGWPNLGLYHDADSAPAVPLVLSAC